MLEDAAARCQRKLAAGHARGLHDLRAALITTGVDRCTTQDWLRVLPLIGSFAPAGRHLSWIDCVQQL
jgi:hypothetical protein